MKKLREVRIDGVRYVPVLESGMFPKVIATELIARYMGEFDEKDLQRLSDELTVCVSEDNGEPTVADTVADIVSRLLEEQRKRCDKRTH